MRTPATSSTTPAARVHSPRPLNFSRPETIGKTPQARRRAQREKPSRGSSIFLVASFPSLRRGARPLEAARLGAAADVRLHFREAGEHESAHRHHRVPDGNVEVVAGGEEV